MKTYKIEIPKHLTDDEALEFAELAVKHNNEIIKHKIELASFTGKKKKDIKKEDVELQKALKAVETKEIQLEYNAIRKIDIHKRVINYYDNLTKDFLKSEPFKDDFEDYDESEIEGNVGLFEELAENGSLIELGNSDSSIESISVNGTTVYEKEKELQAEEL